MCDDFISKVTKPSINSIYNSFRIRHHLLDNLSTFLDSLPCLRSEINFPVFLDDRLKDRWGESFSIDEIDFISVGRLASQQIHLCNILLLCICIYLYPRRITRNSNYQFFK